jgi:glycosyltransferase 2 family protein
MRKFWVTARKWLPGVIISIVIFIALAIFVDWQRFLDALRSANYWLILAVLLISIIWLVIRAIVWKTLIRGKATFRDVFFSINEGYLLNNFLPFRLGEIGKAFLLAKKSRLPFMEVLPLVVIERILDTAFAALILLSSIPLIAEAKGAEGIAFTIGGLVLIGIVALYFIARNQERIIQILERLTRRWIKIQQFMKRVIIPLLSGLAILTDGKVFIKVVLWMIVNWGVAIFQFYLLLLAFFPNAKIEWALFSLGAVAFANAIPSLPGAVGTFEGALTAALTLLSGEQSVSFAAAIAAHLSNFIASGLIGLYAFSREGETIMGVYHQLRNRRDEIK